MPRPCTPLSWRRLCRLGAYAPQKTLQRFCGSSQRGGKNQACKTNYHVAAAAVAHHLIDTLIDAHHREQIAVVAAYEQHVALAAAQRRQTGVDQCAAVDFAARDAEYIAIGRECALHHLYIAQGEVGGNAAPLRGIIV